MAFTEKLPEWQAEGIEPPDSKKQTGWEVEDKPPAGWWNWLLHRTFKVLEELRSKAADKEYVDEAVAGVKVDVPDASLTVKGKVQLSSATDSTSETMAATPKAVKAVSDGAQTKANTAETNAKTYADQNFYNKQKLDATNVIRNGRAIFGMQDWVIGAGTWTTVGDYLTVRGGYFYPTASPAAGNHIYIETSSPIGVTPNTVWALGATFHTIDGLSTDALRVEVADSTTGNIIGTLFSDNNKFWHRKTMEVTIPAGVTAVKLRIACTGPLTNPMANIRGTTQIMFSVDGFADYYDDSADLRSLFLSGANVKANVVAALVALGVTATTNDSWDALISKMNILYGPRKGVPIEFLKEANLTITTSAILGGSIYNYAENSNSIFVLEGQNLYARNKTSLGEQWHYSIPSGVSPQHVEANEKLGIVAFTYYDVDNGFVKVIVLSPTTSGYTQKATYNITSNNVYFELDDLGCLNYVYGSEFRKIDVMTGAIKTTITNVSLTGSSNWYALCVDRETGDIYIWANVSSGGLGIYKFNSSGVKQWFFSYNPNGSAALAIGYFNGNKVLYARTGSDAMIISMSGSRIGTATIASGSMPASSYFSGKQTMIADKSGGVSSLTAVNYSSDSGYPTVTRSNPAKGYLKTLTYESSYIVQYYNFRGIQGLKGADVFPNIFLGLNSKMDKIATLFNLNT